ncbi:glycosyltransferase family 87 protein [Halobacterium sp. CBA1126]|uniref:glycosyltransferase family 87 protein n=1 Tax=Halobacterium sp. CBA1126 TaxID=2668074 RepID=UPI0018D24FE5|nr:glycosyltransferase family 87 protein [Halobacterium sp. CBA1126]
MIQPPSRRMMLIICLSLCILNILLVGILAGTGTLKTAERGDIQYTSTQISPEGDITVPPEADYRYAIERPTDADAFYNMVIRVWSGGPLYNTWQPDNVQEFHYFPTTYYFFATISLFGYVVYKFILLGLSILATGFGTYLLLDVETEYADFEPSKKTLMGISAASIGFAPMVANFKVGQMTPFAYLCAAVAWWSYRRSSYTGGGTAIALATLVKPYWAAPTMVFASLSDNRWRGLLGFGITILAANALSVATFGFDTTEEYYSIIVDTLLASSKSVGPVTTWSVEALNVFWFLGEYAVFARLLTIVPVVWVFVHYVRRNKADIELYALSILLLFTALGSTTLIDLGLVLAAFVVFGVHAFGVGGWSFAILGGAFVLTHVHTYVMEVVVGSGHANLVGLLDAHPVLTLLQPGVYGVLAFYVLALWWARRAVSGMPYR